MAIGMLFVIIVAIVEFELAIAGAFIWYGIKLIKAKKVQAQAEKPCDVSGQVHPTVG